MESLKRISLVRINAPEKEFIEDLLVDLNQSFEICKSALKGLSNMRDYYSTTLTSNLNRVITLLTFFTVFLTIPAVISSIYGMNIALPLQDNPSLFAGLFVLVLGIWAVLLFIFKKLKVL